MSEYRGEKPGEPKDEWKQDGEVRRREIRMEGPDVPEMSRRMDMRLTPEQRAEMERRAQAGIERQRQAEMHAEDIRDKLRMRTSSTSSSENMQQLDTYQMTDTLLRRHESGLQLDGGKRSLWEKFKGWSDGTRQKQEMALINQARDAVRAYGERNPGLALDVDRIQSVEEARAAINTIRRHRDTSKR